MEYAVGTCRRIGHRKNRRKSGHQETESYLNSGQRIIQVFEDVNEDYLTVAATIGVNWSTARSIVARETTRTSISFSSRWWNEKLLELPANTDKSRIDHILVHMPSLPSLLVRDFLLSKYWIHNRLQIYYDSLQHSAWTRWHSRPFFTARQGGFVHLEVALPILLDTTYLQMFLLLFGHVLPVFLGRGCLNSWFICASVSRQFSFKMSFRQFLISSSTRKWFDPPRGLSAILSSSKYRATILLAVDQFTPIVAATVK